MEDVAGGDEVDRTVALFGEVAEGIGLDHRQSAKFYPSPQAAKRLNDHFRLIVDADDVDALIVKQERGDGAISASDVDRPDLVAIRFGKPGYLIQDGSMDSLKVWPRDTPQIVAVAKFAGESTFALGRRRIVSPLWCARSWMRAFRTVNHAFFPTAEVRRESVSVPAVEADLFVVEAIGQRKHV